MAGKTLEFDVLAIDAASKAFASIAKAADRLDKQLDRLDGKTIDVDAELNTKKADVQIGKFAEDTRRKLAAAFKSLPQVELTSDSSDVDRDISRIRNELEALHGQRVGIDIDSGEFLAEIHRLELELRELGDSSPDVQVRADTAAAMGQLAALRREVEALDGDDAKVDVKVDDHGSASKAASELSNIQRYALLAAAATPLIGAGVVALPGLLAAAAVPAAAVLTGLQGIKDAAASIAPQFRQVQSAVSAAFVNGLAPAMANVSRLFPTLQTGLVGTASALSGIATQVTGVVSSTAGLAQLQNIFSGVNAVVSSLAPGIAKLTSGILTLAQGGLAGLQQLGGVIDTFASKLQSVFSQLTASGTAQAAVSGLVSVLGGLLNILPPIVQAGAQLMAALGPPLAGALNVVAGVLGVLTGPLGSVTTAVIALAAAWKVSSIAGAAFATLGTRIQSGWSRVGSALSGANAGFVATGAAATTAGASGEKAATSAGKVSAAFAKVGNTLPIIGAAIVGIGMAYESLVPNAEDAASAMIAGGDAATAAATKLREQNAQFREGSILGNLFRVSQSDINAEFEKQVALMSPLQAAQARVNYSQSLMNQAVADFGPSSQQARDATADYQQKLLDLQKAQSDAAIKGANLGLAFQSAAQHFRAGAAATDAAQQSAVLLSTAYANLADPLQTASQKADSFSAAFRAAVEPATILAQSTQAVNDAMRALGDAADSSNTKLITAQGTINTTTEAGSKLQTAFLTAAQAIGDNYGPAVTAAVAAGKDMNTASAEAAVSFANQKAALVDLLVSQGASRDAAQALADTYIKIPKEMSTVISQPGMAQAIVDAAGLKDKIVAVPDNKSVIVSALTDAARQQLEALGLQVTTLPNGQILITADGSPARGEVVTTVQFANGQVGIITVDANNQPADGKTTASVQFADGSVGTITFDGNNIPANGTVDATVRYADGSVGTVQVKARDAGAIQTARNIASIISAMSASIKVVATPFGALPAGGGVMGRSGGGVNGFAGGGVVRARRGMVLPGYAPGKDTIPAVLSKGEAVLVPELVRALGASRILAANAEASGGRPPVIVGSIASMMDGMIRGGPPKASAAVSSAVSTVRTAAASQMQVVFNATFSSIIPTGSAEQRAAVAWITEQVRRYTREGK